MTGKPLPATDDASAPFWAAAAERRLVVQRCAACGLFRHPPRPMCPSCRSLDHAWENACGRGRVWSWVVVHAPVLPAFSSDVPYNVVVIELDEGVRMIGNLLGVAGDDIRDGLEVEATFEDAGDGVVLPQWKPA